MANIPKYTDKDFQNEGIDIDFNLKRLYDMPNIEQLIFFHSNYDVCRREIMNYEEARTSNNSSGAHPKTTKKQAIDLL